MKVSRREVLATVCAAAGARLLPAQRKPRTLRKDAFFGLHFDLHPTAEDQALGADITEEMIESLLDACMPDFVQYDSKGHPGWLGFPSKTGMSAPHIAQDSLLLWRRVTARKNVSLLNHFSSVLDGYAAQKHPEWARVGPDGKRDADEMSLFSRYEDELMIPELTEAAVKYDLDGTWVDGDCWAVRPDYSAESVTQFRAKTGVHDPPAGPADPRWNDFLESQREQFRHWISKYVAALQAARPGYQVTSNWMYSTLAPEHPTLPLEYLSGDIADQAPVRRARIEARYFAATGKPWDLMSWGFECDSRFGHKSVKPAVELQQEAAIVLVQGGAYQIYDTPTRRGWIDQRIIRNFAAVAKFCRERQEICHRSKSVPEAAILFSGRSLYTKSNRVFGPWGSAIAPAEGAVDLLIGCGYSTDIVPDWKADQALSAYQLVVVPDWENLGGDVMAHILAYAGAGGKVLLCGAANAALFGSRLHLHTAGVVTKTRYFAVDDIGFALIQGDWLDVTAPEPQILERAYPDADTRHSGIAMGIRVPYGEGVFMVCPRPLTAEYASWRTPVILSVVRRLASTLHERHVQIDPVLPSVEVALRTKDGDLFLHFINLAGAPVTGEFRHTGYVPPTGALQVVVRLQAKPETVYLEPARTVIHGEYSAGMWRCTLEGVRVHAALRFVGATR